MDESLEMPDHLIFYVTQVPVVRTICGDIPDSAGSGDVIGSSGLRVHARSAQYSPVVRNTHSCMLQNLIHIMK